MQWVIFIDSTFNIVTTKIITWIKSGAIRELFCSISDKFACIQFNWICCFWPIKDIWGLLGRASPCMKQYCRIMLRRWAFYQVIFDSPSKMHFVNLVKNCCCCYCYCCCSFYYYSCLKRTIYLTAYYRVCL